MSGKQTPEIPKALVGCASEEIGLKSFFLGPQAENSDWVEYQVCHIFKSWFNWRRSFRPVDGAAISKADQAVPDFKKQQAYTEELLTGLAQRFEREIPKFSPRYIGHMFSETSLPALFGHILTLLHNPNNISAESAPVGVEIENEALQELAKMMGYKAAYGHFTSGGTVANYEMLFRARAKVEQRGHSMDSAVLLVPAHKHYSWVKGAYVFGIKNYWAIPLDDDGHLDTAALSSLIDKANAENRAIIGVISVLGTTEMGLLDPIHKVQAVLDGKQTLGHTIWHHIDAAYGAFFRTVIGDHDGVQSVLSQSAVEALKAVPLADSITLDPHKLGYVPYASGVFLCRTREDYTRVAFGAPYVNFSEQTDKGLFTLEGSRSATGAAATWMTARAVGFDQNGYGRIIARTIRIRRELEAALAELEGVRVAPRAETNLLCFALAYKGDSIEVSNDRANRFYQKMNQSDSPFYVSKTKLGLSDDAPYAKYVRKWLASLGLGVSPEDKSKELVLIRLTLMNPFLDSQELNSRLMSEFVNHVGREK
ncbi:MAG: pyridoxal-dependent decarboxylase [Bdellovibrionales bacterium]|nr:pyridoxal-dependent decarboxylase [Bdellovibrionales bacterium]